MKIAINCMFCTPHSGGIKEYIVNLTRNLALIDKENEYIYYVLEDQIDYARKQLPAVGRIKKIPFKSNLFEKIKRSLLSQRFWTKEEETEEFDIFHSPFFYAPKFKKAKLIVTVHDLRLYRFPQTYPLLRLVFLRHSVKETINRANAIIAVSNFTKNEIVEYCNIPESRIIVIHEAIDRAAFSEKSLEKYTLPAEFKVLIESRFIFSLGHIEPRKNYIRLIEAFELVKKRKEFEDLKLVIAGRLNWKSREVRKLIGRTEDVIYLKFVPRELLLWLYKHTSLFVFPSYYEGFGFPPLEAASMGTVSAVSQVSSIPEVCGDSVFYFDPYNVEKMSEVIMACLDDVKIITNKKMELEKQLDLFSWRKNAQLTMDLYKKVLSLS